MADYYGSECTVVHVLRDQLSIDPDRIWIKTEGDSYSWQTWPGLVHAGGQPVGDWCIGG